MMFDGSIENISCITQHVDYDAITNRAVLLQVAPLLRNKDGGTYRRQGGVSENEWVQNLSECYPGPRSFLWFSFFYLEICDAKRWSALSASCQQRIKIKEAVFCRKICQVRIKESLWDQGIRMYVKRENKIKKGCWMINTGIVIIVFINDWVVLRRSSKRDCFLGGSRLLFKTITNSTHLLTW